MNRTDIINYLIKKNKAKKYLEIGVADGANFKKINCDTKIGVDPNPDSKATKIQTSDDFFKENKQFFDIIFIDGLHHADQVIKDINNALSCMSANGYIICHDILPPDEQHQTVPPTQDLWTGDCWKAWVSLRTQRIDLNMHTIDTDYGCGIISKGSQKTLNVKKEQLNWANFLKNKQFWMNVISVEDFKKLF